MFKSSREETDRFVVLSECRSDTGPGCIGLENERLVCPGQPEYGRGNFFLESCDSQPRSMIERKGQLFLCCEQGSYLI